MSRHDAAENLHRAELTVLERAEHIAEWLRLTDEQNKGATCADIPRGRGQPQGGINAATRELGIDRTEAQRSVKVAAITPEAKQEAVAAGIDDNQADKPPLMGSVPRACRIKFLDGTPLLPSVPRARDRSRKISRFGSRRDRSARVRGRERAIPWFLWGLNAPRRQPGAWHDEAKLMPH